MSMTNEEADLEAKKRWGEYACVYYASPNITEDGCYTVYSDQRYSHGEGVGNNWEEAFANADKKVKKQGRLL